MKRLGDLERAKGKPGEERFQELLEDAGPS
jgi:hypothetical protein